MFAYFILSLSPFPSRFSSISEMRLVVAAFMVGIAAAAQAIVTCPDKGQCLDGYTCCQLKGGETQTDWDDGTICCDPRRGIDKYSQQTREKSEDFS